MVFGLFKSKRKTYISSAVYNMAGEITDRPDYLKTIVIGGALKPRRKESLSDLLVSSTLRGPYMDQTSWYRWAQSNYPEGKLRARYNGVVALDETQHAQIQSGITEPSFQFVNVQDAWVDYPNIDYWAERHILSIRPEDIDLDWEATFDELTQMMIVTYPEGSSGSSSESVSVPDYDSQADDYLFAHYDGVRANTEHPSEVVTQTGLVTKPTIQDGNKEWVFQSKSVSTETVTLERKRTIIERQDGTITNQETTTSTVDVEMTLEVEDYTRVVELGADPMAPRKLIENQSLTVTKGFEVSSEIRTITGTPTEDGKSVDVVLDNEIAVVRWSTTQSAVPTTTEDRRGTQQLLIYKLGSGNVALDALRPVSDPLSGPVPGGSPGSGFYPVIPVRLKKSMITNENISRAYKRAHDQTLDDLQEKIKDNDDLEDVNNVFQVFGVEANSRDKNARRYIYEFLRHLKSLQSFSQEQFDAWIASLKEQKRILKKEEEWLKGQEDIFHPLFNTPRPAQTKAAQIMAPSPSRSTLVLDSEHPNLTSVRYRVSLEWAHIQEYEKTGLGKRDAKVGDFWWTHRTVTDAGARLRQQKGLFNGKLESGNISVSTLYWQYEKGKFRQIDVFGMTHRQIVVDNKAEVTRLRDAIEAAGSDEEEGFIFPLHQGTLLKIPMTVRNQLAVENRILVFNAYKRVKKRWYQRGIFRVLLFVAVIVVSAFLFPAAGGLLGANMAIGASLGLSGTAAVIAGAVANALASMVLTNMISLGASSLFGEEMGALLGSVIGFMTLSAIGSLTSGASFNLVNLLNPQNLLGLADAVLRGISDWANTRMGNIQNEMVRVGEEYKEENDLIRKQMMDMFGDSIALIDPLILTQSLGHTVSNGEDIQTFFDRTIGLPTGIIELQMAAIEDFADAMLEPDLLIRPDQS